MGNQIGFIKIANLEGTVQALATAADLDQDGKVGAGELAVFNRLVGEAGLNQDQGLVLEREQLGTRGTKEATPKDLAKQEDRMYKECFGFKSGSADLANFKAQIAVYDSRVIAVFKKLKEAGDVEIMVKLNDQIANRPDMTNYIGNSAGYLAQLDKYADAAEALLQQSDRQYQAGLAQGLHEHVGAGIDFLAGITLAVGEELKANMDENTAEILQAIQDGTAEIIDQIKDSEGNIKQTIKLSTGQICQVVRNAQGVILGAMKENTTYLAGVVRDDGNATRFQIRETRDTLLADGEKTRGTVRMEHKTTRNTLLADGEKTRKTFNHEADRIIDTLDPLGKQRAIQFVRDKAINAGKSVGDFIKENPELLIPGLGIPLYAAKKLFE